MDFVRRATTGDRKDRIWWTIMFALCTAACAHLIYKVWNKWDESPVIVSFAETSTPVWQIPFPAVTVCSETKARQTLYNFTTMYHKNNADNLTAEETPNYESMGLVCDNHLVRQGRKYTNYSTIEFLTEVAPKMEEMMWHCKWKTLILDCSYLFTPILTEEGLCYTFNMLHAEELFRKETLHLEYNYLNHLYLTDGWTVDEGYPEHSPLVTYPMRVTGSGTTAGLHLLLRAQESDLDYLCRGPVQGFKVLLHTPSEIPRVKTQYFRVPLSQEVIAAIKPNMMTTSPGLRNYNPERRQCFFQSERKLRFFQIYNQNNCELECTANYTLRLCGCVTFSMPRELSTQICSSGSTDCVIDAEDDLMVRRIKKGRFEARNNTNERWQNMDEEMDELASQCNCLPACTSINYEVEISQADFAWKKLYQAFNLNQSEGEDLNMARMVLMFKESQFITSRRSELYGQTDFLANCGGLLGLCLGFSILSLVEIIYFITLRAFCNLKNKVSRKKEYNENIIHVQEMESNKA